jgi:hypothetical protein
LGAKEALLKCSRFIVIEFFPSGSSLASNEWGQHLESLGLTMNSQLGKRRAISILAVLGAILVLIAAWNPGDNESF